MRKLLWFVRKWWFIAGCILWRGDTLTQAKLWWSIHLMDRLTRQLQLSEGKLPRGMGFKRR